MDTKILIYIVQKCNCNSYSKNKQNLTLNKNKQAYIKNLKKHLNHHKLIKNKNKIN